MSNPRWGHTWDGRPVHAHIWDHHPDSTTYQRFNKKVARTLTRNVGTMTCFWVFLTLCFCVLPSVLHAMGYLSKWFLPVFLLGFGFELAATWLLSTTFQLILLPGLMVGQNLQNEAADVRAAKTFEDVEAVKADLLLALDRLDCGTEGGLKAVLDAVNAMPTRDKGTQ